MKQHGKLNKLSRWNSPLGSKPAATYSISSPLGRITYFPITKMISLISTCLLLVNAVVSLATSSETTGTVKILSPLPGTSIHLGASLNVTLQIEKDSMKGSQQVLLGFGLNSEASSNPTSLGEVFLGLLNTTQTPFNATGQLTWSLSIPAREKFNSTATSFSLVVSQYMFSGVSHTPHCGLVSVPVKVGAQTMDPAGAGHGAGKTSPTPSSPAPETSKDPKSVHPATSNPPPSMEKSTPGEKVPPMTKAEIKASMSAKGHNTAATIPGSAVKVDGPAPGPATSSTPPTSNVTTSPAPKAETTTPPAAKNNGTTATPEPESSAVLLSISASHVFAGLAVIASIFATV
ncbi:hypothetical protein Pst134EA_024569 [Puccinia striiformis f. sp. tritici]|nr:hypothetical protein Pst134EA_024569 [Puccinia striiformis f. sp. tritici]KAH9453705.1 hypothetical protein Pst134EA_024569 [Puccinia striiformis f. sp. tritici]